MFFSAVLILAGFSVAKNAADGISLFKELLMNKKLFFPILILLISLLAISPLVAREAQGLEPLPEALNISMPQANPHGIVTAAGSVPGDGIKKEVLPRTVDLRGFLPPVDNQGQIGSCAAWSTVYYAKTIQENQERGWGAENPAHQYSPLFTYNQITKGVNRGTAIVEHMILMEKLGAAPLSAFPYPHDINIQPDEKALNAAGKYMAASHKSLEEYDSETKTWSVDLQAVKMALAEGFPVVGGFQVYGNFYHYKGGIYDRAEGAASGGHAMCIVGYDDRKGALLIVNSWGSDWGEDGFLWLDYDLFDSLCIYGCVVMYDTIDSVPDKISAPADLSGTKGVYTDRIELSWQPVERAEYYLVYKVSNREGKLKEIARTQEPTFTDSDLPQGVNYIYAVKSGRQGVSGAIESDFSEITEGWTAEEHNPPGIPANLSYGFTAENPVLVWDPVDEADGYNVYRWSPEDESFMLTGTSEDGAYTDFSFSDISQDGLVYYIVQACNRYGEGYPSDSIAVLKDTVIEDKGDEEIVINDAGDDDEADASEQEKFEGGFYRTEYFDYEYSMARFREYYEQEMKAFRDFQKKEEDAFEAWKKKNSM